MRMWAGLMCAAMAVGCVQAQMVWEPVAGHGQVAIWPGAIPDADAVPPTGPETMEVSGPTELIGGKRSTAISHVSRPTMTVYRPKGKNTGVAMVVFPGGGYSILAIDLEGTEVCDWLVSRGMTCVLLKYRVPDSGPAYHESCKCNIVPKAETALEDAQRTVGLVRYHSKEWGIDPHKIGVVGFSAGGHMVANISTHWQTRIYKRVDAADDVSCRPDFAIGVYPGHMMEHITRPWELNPTLPVNAQTPPTFLVMAEDDHVDGVKQALTYYIALLKAGVPTEMHLYAKGGHAFGLRHTQNAITDWPALVERWLVSIGMLGNG